MPSYAISMWRLSLPLALSLATIGSVACSGGSDASHGTEQAGGAMPIAGASGASGAASGGAGGSGGQVAASGGDGHGGQTRATGGAAPAAGAPGGGGSGTGGDAALGGRAPSGGSPAGGSSASGSSSMGGAAPGSGGAHAVQGGTTATGGVGTGGSAAAGGANVCSPSDGFEVNDCAQACSPTSPNCGCGFTEFPLDDQAAIRFSSKRFASNCQAGPYHRLYVEGGTCMKIKVLSGTAQISTKDWTTTSGSIAGSTCMVASGARYIIESEDISWISVETAPIPVGTSCKFSCP